MEIDSDLTSCVLFNFCFILLYCKAFYFDVSLWRHFVYWRIARNCLQQHCPLHLFNSLLYIHVVHTWHVVFSFCDFQSSRRLNCVHESLYQKVNWLFVWSMDLFSCAVFQCRLTLFVWCTFTVWCKLCGLKDWKDNLWRTATDVSCS